jgi:coproporphyrinogen III oxidase
VNFSEVHGELSPAFTKELPGDGKTFFATGVSLVLHPRSPRIPSVHANWRYIEHGSASWFGGGADLTPYVPEAADDARHFHTTLKAQCDAHDAGYYPAFKARCDEYFHLPHRNEMRGVGGIFWDYLGLEDGRPADRFAFIQECAGGFIDAYIPIVQRRKGEAWTERERQFQLLRRGRYAEFNLLYDRGTKFGLMTGGRVESILMSMPPLTAWQYNHQPAPGSAEAQVIDMLQPRDWVTAG